MRPALLALALFLFASAAHASIQAEGDVEPEPAITVVPEGNVATIAVTPEGTAAPVEDSHYICTPGFMLSDADGTLHLKGSIDTPTPGYAYDITDVDQTEKGKVSGILRLSPPSGGAVIQVISHLDINFDVPADTSDFSGLTLGLEKSFNWGISSIACSPVADGDDVPPQ